MTLTLAAILSAAGESPAAVAALCEGRTEEELRAMTEDPRGRGTCPICKRADVALRSDGSRMRHDARGGGLCPDIDPWTGNAGAACDYRDARAALQAELARRREQR